MSNIRRSFLEGKAFGRLAVLEYAGRGRYHCLCACGKRTITTGTLLRTGKEPSCGCLRAELVLISRTKHGLSKTEEYRAWAQMRSRCNCPTHLSYKDYGGRGIAVCERWDDASNFFADMGPKPSKHHSIDRIDNGKGYSPENCRWATASQQHRNTRANRALTHNGVTKPLCEWADERGIATTTLTHRLKKGWSSDEILFRPVGRWVAAV